MLLCNAFLSLRKSGRKKNIWKAFLWLSCFGLLLLSWRWRWHTKGRGEKARFPTPNTGAKRTERAGALKGGQPRPKRGREGKKDRRA